MTYVPHSAADRKAMLDVIGVKAIDDLFGAIPPKVKYPALKLPKALSELEILRELETLSETNVDLGHYISFLGAGAYNHYVPSVVDHVISRSEFFTAYTPYQPELSQGTLQTIFEYQSMVCALTGMEVANASHYDGATAAAEAVIMALSAGRGKRRKAVVSPYLHPEYRATICTYTQGMDVEIVGDENGGARDLEGLIKLIDNETACVIVQNPDFLGRLESPAALAKVAEAAHKAGALFVVSVYPISLGLLVPPGEYGADIVTGEGQALGNGLNYGGPYLGFFACKEEHVRRMAGRLVGETVDVNGKRGYVLTLSTREQHIRREKATSNICTNEGLNALAAGVYMAALGKCGLRQVAELCYHKAHYAADRIGAVAGFRVDRTKPFFNEFMVKGPQPVATLNDKLLQQGIVGGYDLGRFDPRRADTMLVAVTEMNTRADIDRFADVLGEVAR
jgi:glycine dehydrogenase subunit 1